MNKILAICGLTATGKTDLAFDVAQNHNGEIISIDSRQAYEYMDVGTGKDLLNTSKYTLVDRLSINNESYQFGYYERDTTKFWLYDVAKPSQPMHVALLVTLTWKAIDSCWKRNKLPILVGGDGFYLKSILNPPQTMTILPNQDLRNKLDKFSIKELQDQLKEVNSERWQLMNISDQQNPRRLIRAIEVSLSKERHLFQLPQHDVLKVGLIMDNDSMLIRIKDRVQSRLNKGFEQELKNLLRLYPQFFTLPGARTLGYQQWLEVLSGRITKDQGADLWTQAEVSYAKRQKTWFQKQKDIKWFAINSDSWYAQAMHYITPWIYYEQ